jgi:hypothetical protein
MQCGSGPYTAAPPQTVNGLCLPCRQQLKGPDSTCRDPLAGDTLVAEHQQSLLLRPHLWTCIIMASDLHHPAAAAAVCSCCTVQEEERERRMDFVPEQSAINTENIEVCSAARQQGAHTDSSRTGGIAAACSSQPEQQPSSKSRTKAAV